EEYRPLNVKDALTYLDKVKAKFSSQTQVYNQFLDIMKDFKSQMIDTPGVIERVSTLFRGHPILISGFNTFLPPGYRIECSIDDQERNIIKVTTPSGTTCIKDTESLDLRQDAATLPTSKKKAPVEFNHAITYVNKIKSRFANQPDTYKKFLEILQTYQKDQKPIQEVYAEVQVLFNSSNELLDEFKQFLPEPKQRKKRSGNIPTLSISKRTKHHHKTDLQTSDVRSNNNCTTTSSTTTTAILTDDLARPTFSAEEAEFFEKVKTYIGNKATYNAFLKVLNLFSQQIMDQNVLVNRVESFIGGNKELFDWFKTLVGYDGEDEIIENVPILPVHQRKESASDQFLCGPSYRHTPKVWQNRTCSGRDALCWDVLNDTYISHPTWASEDTGYVAAKKNQYEEALHRVEEERYDYDLNIEANLNTIALLEPIAKKISIMSPEEKSGFRLPPGLGSPSRTIYQRIIKKIYGTEKGLEIIELLHKNPAQTVPILLKRLKQKDDEWKRAQREWNKIWREVEAKNYWKSLDYQGITFKMTDRKAMTTRHLVSEAETVRSNQPESVSLPQFQFLFADQAVFKDVSRLIYFFLERQPVYNVEDCEAMRVFMNTLVPMFFDVEDVEPSTIDTTDIIMDEVVDEDDKSSVMSIDSLELKKVPVTASRSTRPRRGQLQDDDGLLKDVLTRNLKKVSTGNSSDDDDDDDEDEDEDDDEHEDEDHEEPPRLQREQEDDEEDDEEDEDEEDEDDDRPRYSRQNQKTYNFFGGNGFYCFFRLYQVLYDRLCKMKALDAEFRCHPEKSKKACEEAHELGITPRKFKALKMDTKNGYYNMLLALVDKLFEGEIDQQTYEECVRYNFGTDAYIMFTIDKLVLSLVRHIHIIMTDTQSQELYDLFKNEHKAEEVDQGDVVTYRTRVAGVIDSADNTYHITFKLKSRTLSIRLLNGNTTTTAAEEEGCGGYDEYVSNYIDWANETKGVDQSLLTPRFLKRNIKCKGNQGKDIQVRSGMQYKICRDTYHMFYIIGTEDAFVRHCMKPKITLPNWNQWVDKDWPNERDKFEAEAKALSLLQ
ncbi:hypothetical protein EDC94DRAFT_517900, partial [Helicostylum pulchrum]